MLPSVALAVLLGAGCVASQLTERSTVDDSYHLIGYWGANLARNQFTDTADQEKSLYTFCAVTNYTYIHLSYVYTLKDSNGLPGIDLSSHCEYPTNAWSGLNAPTDGYVALNCKSVGSDITKCQKLGKKIILSVSPVDFITADEATTAADALWNVYLGGTSSYRAFGDATVDGVDFHVFNNDFPGNYTTLISHLNDLNNAYSGDKFIIAASVRCALPDVTMGAVGNSYYTTSPFYVLPTVFSYVTVFMTSSPNICGWEINNSGFWTQAKLWLEEFSTVNPSLKVYIGLPSWSTPSYDNAAIGDYISVDDIYDDNVVPLLRAYDQFGGIAMNDVSFDYQNNPCGNYYFYSDIFHQQLVANISLAGNNTPSAYRCSSGSLDPPKASGTGASSTVDTSGAVSAFSTMAFTIVIPFTLIQLLWFR